MPNLSSSKKALRKAQRRYERNKRVKERIKRWFKKYFKLLEQGKTEDAKKILPFVQKLIDKAAKRNIYHKNKASRMISKLYKQLNELSLSAKK